ncbi:hypothetical protein GQ54DRAFT_311447 [Martensiomyces pterosporus]|nr:hypothetical protein GQ54DRAFT_311447 [Martensiomyces pterosporus]
MAQLYLVSGTPAAMQSTISSPGADQATNPPSCCRRHRRNSDVFAENKLFDRFSSSSVDCGDDDGQGSSGGRKAAASHDGALSTASVAGLAESGTHGGDLHAKARHDESPTIRKHHHYHHYHHNHHNHHNHHAHHHNHHHLSRNHSVSSHHSAHGHASQLIKSLRPPATPAPENASWAHGSINAPGPACHASAAFQETIKGNTQEEPMSSVKAWRIFDTVLSANGLHADRVAELPEHDPSCKQCVSEALVTAHQAAADGISHGGHGELRMNLGNGRNGVYVAPCEKHLECPLEKKGKYLIHTHKPKIMTDMSKVEFGICVDGWRRIVFKTVNDPALAKRELSFYRMVAASQPDHVMQLLDEFTDNSKKHVMVFPRMNCVNIQGRDLFDVAYISRQLFIALDDLHRLGVAHLDITPTNLMSDPNDSSHVEIIDFGLACDITTAANGQLPSRGTCGFVAPEILSGGAKDLRADVYSAGVVLGMMLQNYLPTVSLRLLGGPLIRSDTTDMIIGQIDELLDAYKYTPEAADFVECNTMFVQPGSMAVGEPLANGDTGGKSHPKPSCLPTASQQDMPLAAAQAVAAAPAATKTPSRAETYARHSHRYSDEEDEAAAFAAAYVGGSSLYGGYGSISDDDDDDDAGNGRLASTGTFYSRNSYSTTQLSRHMEHTGSGSSSSTANNSASDTCTSNGPRYAHSIGGCESDYASATCFGDSYPGSSGYYRSPSNTPVYSRNGPYGKQNRNGSLANILAAAPTNHSSSRYAHASLSTSSSSCGRSYSAGVATAIRPATSIQSNASSTSGSGSSGKYSRVPAAVLHAADLLRWCLQANPQCRPTAKQALEHPFLVSIEIKKPKRRTSSSLQGAASPPRVDASSPGGAAASTQSPPFFALTSPLLHPLNVVLSQDDGLCLACTSASIVMSPDYGGCGCEGTTDKTGGALGGAKNSGPECNSKAATLVPTPTSAASNASIRSQGIFKDTAARDIHLWEGEMHSRLAHATHSDRMEADGYSRSYGDKDEVSNFYSSHYNDDLTSYFY